MIRKAEVRNLGVASVDDGLPEKRGVEFKLTFLRSEQVGDRGRERDAPLEEFLPEP